MSGCDVTSGGCDRSELIRAEYIVCQSQVPAGVYILPSFDAPIDKWCGVMFLRQGQFYRGGIFKFWISFPDNFPESPPQIQFISKVHHPHVHPDTGVVDFGTEFNYVRAVSPVVVFKIVPTGPSTCHVTRIAHMDPKGNIPAMMVNMFIQKQAHVFSMMREILYH
ncbi:hypothetical protein Pelo_5135 [Pelomyxa schiedti]|nr:hypothetical protein Pelo_5135 [Pelomyxa schiedti]